MRVKALSYLIAFCLVVLGLNQASAACPNLTLSFTHPGQNGCGVPQNIVFNNTSTGTAANNNTWYYWRVNGVLIDSSLNTIPNFTYSFGAPGTYTVRMIARTVGNCRDSIQQNVVITSNTPQVYNGLGALSYQPIWNNCILNPLQNDNFNISIASNVVLNNYTIIWGDGSPNASGVSLAVGSSVNHTYTALGLYTVRIVTVNGTCTDTITGTVYNMRPVSTSIKPLPSGQLAGCAPHTITFQDSTQHALPGTILTWNFGDGTIITRDWTQANQPISHTYLPVGTGNCVYTVSLRAFNSNCNTGPNNASTYTISPILIFDKDQAGINPPANLCLPSLTYTFGNSSVDNCITGQRYYYWDFGDGTNTGWITTRAAQTHTFPDYGNYTIMLIDSNPCGSDTTYATVVLNTPPQVGFTLTPKFGCAPLTVNVNDTSIGIGNTRTWTFTGGTPGSSTLVSRNVTYNTPGTYVVRLQVSNSCATNVTRRDTVRVYARPVVQIGNAISGCVPHTVTPTNNTINQSPTATYYWDFGNGQTSTLRNPGPITYNSTGNFTIKLVVTDTCGKDSQQVNIAVSTLPTANFSADTVCRSNATQFTGNSTLAPGDVITQHRWYFGNGDSATSVLPTQNYTYPTQGTFTAVLKITTDKNCVDTDTISVLIKPAPIVSFNYLPANVCDKQVVTFNATATTTAPSTITQHRWSFGTADTARVEDTTYLFPAPGSYSIIYTATNNTGCAATSTQNITVHPNPDARLFRNISCSNQFTQFKDSSTVGFGNTITQWAWDFDNNGTTDSTTQHPTFRFLNAGNFKTKLTVTTNNGCSDTDSLNTLVNVSPVANFNPVNASTCVNDTFTFNNISVGAISYGWNFGNNTGDVFESFGTPFKYKYNDTGTYTVKLVAYSMQGCKDSTTRIVNTRPLPVANFVVNDTIGCAPFNFTFNNTSSLSNNYRWLIGNTQTSTQTNRTDTLINQSGQVVVVKLVALNQYNCKPDTAIKTLYTFGNPTPNFTMSSDSGCGPLGVAFTNTTPNGISYVWQLGNGQTTNTVNASSVYMASLNSDSIYTIKLIATNGPGCADSISKTVRVFPNPQSIFTPSVNNGCGPLSVTFNNASTHNFGGNQSNMSFVWQFGNNQNSTQTNPTTTYLASNIQDTLYTARLIAFSRFGCSDTSTASVRVYPNPDARFTVNNPNGCGPLSTTFTNQSIPNDTGTIGMMNFMWQLGNGQTSTQVNPSATYVASNTIDSIYQIRLIAFSEHGCRDTAYENTRVYPNPKSQFTQNVTAGCGPLQVNFTNQSIPNDTGSIDIMSFVWQLGNGNAAITQNASSNYVANILTDTVYRVRLQAMSEHGCIDTISSTVRVHPKPITSFTTNKNSGCGPLLIQFTNTTQLANKYYWNFNDGDTSSAINPSHVFASYPMYDSVYQVKLASQSQYGCLGDTVSTTVIARYIPVAAYFSSNDSICGTGNIAFFNASLGGVQHRWNFGNGQTSAAINPANSFVALPTKDTTYLVRLVTTSPYGCNDTIIKPVKVNALPEALFANVTAACTPHTVNFNNNSLRGAKYHWDFGDATTDSVVTPTKVFENNLTLVNRVYPVTLTAISSSGCIDTAKRNVTVYPLPTANINANKSLRCDTAEFHFLNSTQGASSYFWHFGDGHSSNQQSPTHYYRTRPNIDTNYQIRMVATSVNGCRDTTETTVLVRPLVLADFAASTTSSCLNLDVQFENKSRNAVNYFWLFGDGAGSNDSIPTHAYNNSGGYNITLIAYDRFGCSDTTTKLSYVNIYEIPRAEFVYTPFQPQIPNTTVSFSDRSFIGNGPLTYSWDFGDVNSPNNFSSQQNPSHTFTDSGYYNVRLVVSSINGCTDTITKTLYVFPQKPAPDFDYNPKEGCKPLPVTFTNLSRYAYTYEWDFGDGNTSTEEHPQHTYTRDDTYTVKLKAFGPGGDSTVIKVKIITVHDLPRARFNVAPTMLYLPNSTSFFTNSSFDAFRSNWSVFDQNNQTIFTDTNTNSSFYFNKSGIYSVQLIVMNQFDCPDTAISKNIITVDDMGAVNVPTAFTPNGDGYNETFMPIKTGVRNEGYLFRIYDRWGKSVFETTDVNKAWDGSDNGDVPAVTETYVWLVEGTFVSGERFVKKGTVTLIR